MPEGHAPVASRLYLDLVDPHVAEALLRGPDSMKSAVRALRRDGGALLRALRRRISFNSRSARPAHAGVG